MTDRQHQKLNDLLRQSRPTNRVNWVPEDSPDPAIRKADNEMLNRAIRKAAGGVEVDEPDDQPRRWKSLEPDRRGGA